MNPEGKHRLNAAANAPRRPLGIDVMPIDRLAEALAFVHAA